MCSDARPKTVKSVCSGHIRIYTNSEQKDMLKQTMNVVRGKKRKRIAPKIQLQQNVLSIYF